MKNRIGQMIDSAGVEVNGIRLAGFPGSTLSTLEQHSARPRKSCGQGLWIRLACPLNLPLYQRRIPPLVLFRRSPFRHQ